MSIWPIFCLLLLLILFLDISTIRRCSRSKAELPSGRIVGNKIYVAEILQDRSSNSLNPFENPEAKTPKRIKRILKEKVARLRPQIAKDTAYYAEPIERPWKNQPEEYVFSFNGYMFGQIASHDIGDRKLSKNPDRFAPGYQCCRKSNLAGMGQQISNPACFPIVLPANDPFYSKYNATCLNYVRSSTTVPTSCKMGSAEFVNEFVLLLGDTSHLKELNFLCRLHPPHPIQIYPIFTAPIKGF